MASITIRRIDESLKARLRVRAARHRRTIEEEARCILTSGLIAEESKRSNLADAIRRHLSGTGGVELEIASRDPLRRPLKLT